jgi:hypothetical protein
MEWPRPGSTPLNDGDGMCAAVCDASLKDKSLIGREVCIPIIVATASRLPVDPRLLGLVLAELG